jgi:hypothetical protein
MRPHAASIGRWRFADEAGQELPQAIRPSREEQ